METRILLPPQFRLRFQPSSQLDQQFSETKFPFPKHRNKAHRKKSIPKKRRKSSENHTSSQSDSEQDPESESQEPALGESSLHNSDEEQLETEEDDNEASEENQDQTWTPKTYKRKVKVSQRKHKFPAQASKTSSKFPNSKNSKPFKSVHENPTSISSRGFQIVAAIKIEKGTLISSTAGDSVTLFLDPTPEDTPENLRYAFGCLDQTVTETVRCQEKAQLEEQETAPEDDNDSIRSLSPERKVGQDTVKTIRQTNWIRFVRHSINFTDSAINFIGRIHNGRVVYEAKRSLSTGTEIVVYFDIDSLKQNLQGHQQERKINQNAPLDLSSALPSLPTFPALFKSSPSDSHPGHPAFESILRNVETPSFNPRMSYPFSINDVLAATHPSLYSSALFKSPYSGLLSKGDSSDHDSRGNMKSFHPPPFQHSSPHQTPLFLSNLMKGSIPKMQHASLHHHLLHADSPSPQQPGKSDSRSILRNRGRERSLLPCEVCGKTFDRPSLLKRHMRTHTGEKPHICDVCSKGFSTSSSLNTHRRIHSGEKPHQCPICGKRFTASSNLYYHRMTHNKEKPHKCVLCAKSFPTPGDLKSHQYVHSGSWPYNCPVCHRGFSKQTNLRNHLLLHSGDKPHNCQICGKKFALACNLRAHLRTHEEDSTSSCISCSRSFLTSLNMLDTKGRCQACILQHPHVQRHHQTSRTLTSLTSFRSSHLATSTESFKPGTNPDTATAFPPSYLSPPPLPALNPSPTSSSSSSSSSFITMENHSTESKKSTLSYANPPPNRRSTPSHPQHHSHKLPNPSNPVQSSNKSQRSPLQPQSPGAHRLLSNPIIPPHLLHFFANPFLGDPARQQESFPLSHYIPPDPPSTLDKSNNPLLEQWFKWQWLLANETSPNLGGFHKKLMESQILATQIMSVSLKSSQSASDILNLR